MRRCRLRPPTTAAGRLVAWRFAVAGADPRGTVAYTTPSDSLGGAMPSGSAPAVASVGPGNLDIAVRGNDNALWTRSGLDGRWGSWQPVGGLLSQGPALASSADGRLDVVVRGADRRL